MNLNELTLARGAHKERGDALCVMEAVAYIAGEPHSDHPACSCPVITEFMIRWNDALPNDAERARLLKPLIPLLVGTRTTCADELTRSWMAFDWLARTQLPAWLRLTPAPAVHADAVAALPEIRDAETLRGALPLINNAWAAARDAAWTAAGTAARDTARDTAWATAGNAAWAAAWAAARVAAWAAAWTAARDTALDTARGAALDAARAVAGVAVGAAARAVLAPTVADLQDSVVDLVKRMCAVGRRQEAES